MGSSDDARDAATAGSRISSLALRRDTAPRPLLAKPALIRALRRRDLVGVLLLLGLHTGVREVGTQGLMFKLG